MANTVMCEKHPYPFLDGPISFFTKRDTFSEVVRHPEFSWGCIKKSIYGVIRLLLASARLSGGVQSLTIIYYFLLLCIE